MSQYPSPYSGPYQYPVGYSYDPIHPYLAPARRSSILMFVLGGLGLVCGLCMGAAAFVVPMDQIISQGSVDVSQLQQAGFSPVEFLKIAFVVMGGLIILASILLLVLGIFVRKGSGGATITSIILCALILLVMGINALGTLAQVARDPVHGIFSMALAVGILAAFGMLTAWLIQAARALPAIRAVRMQHQSQMWQYQQQHMQGQIGYGYAGQQQPPQPPSTPPPSQDQGGSHGSSTQG